MDLRIKNMEPSDYKDVFKRIRSDFAVGEYAPPFVLARQMREGVQEGSILLDGGKEVAYAFCVVGEQFPYALISLFAVYREFRAAGYGSAFLTALAGRYAALSGVLAEVEKPECAQNGEEREQRERRIRFYERAGFRLIPGVDYSIWGVPMHLMALPRQASFAAICEQIGDAMHDVYFKLMGRRFIHQMKFKRLF